MNFRMIRYLLPAFMSLALAAAAAAQLAPADFRLEAARSLDQQPPEQRLVSNAIIDILPGQYNDVHWLGTGRGVTKTMRMLGAEPFYLTYETWGAEQGLGKGGVSGLLVTDSIIWTAFAFDTTVGTSGAGGGLAYTRDEGANWTWLPQPRDRIYDLQPDGYDAVLGYWPTATNVDNITYDIAMSDSFVWIVSFGGGLRRHAFATDYTDYNDTTGWQVVTPDTLEFHPLDYLNHRAFSVLYAEGALWVGTANGINKSTDNGRTWQNYTAVNSGISGNFVTALGYQEATGTLWAATWRAEGAGETYAVSKTTDGGATWTVHLTEDDILAATGIVGTARAHGFGFDGDVTYAADDIGLWKSVDGGGTWDLFPRFTDEVTGARITASEVYSVLKHAEILWVGTVDGLAVSLNDGATFRIIQTAQPLSDASRPSQTYAYPNPWSPQRFDPVKLRFHTPAAGNIKVTIYDFAMSEVVELPTVARPVGEQYVTWDGRKDGTIVANGTYFYKIEKPNGEVWGKLIVLD